MRQVEKIPTAFCRRMFSVRSSFSQNVLSCMSLYQAQIVTSFAYVNKPPPIRPGTKPKSTEVRV